MKPEILSSKTLNKIHKIYALYELGIGGEQKNAEILLHKILLKEKITLEEYEEKYKNLPIVREENKLEALKNIIKEIYRYFKKSTFRKKLKFIFFVLYIIFIKNIGLTLRTLLFFTKAFIMLLFLVSALLFNISIIKPIKQYFKN